METVFERNSPTDVFLVLDKMDGVLYGLQDVQEDGSLVLLAREAIDKSLLRHVLDEEQNLPLPSFLVPFVTMNPEPYRYSLFRVSGLVPEKAAQALWEMIREADLCRRLVRSRIVDLYQIASALPRQDVRHLDLDFVRTCEVLDIPDASLMDKARETARDRMVPLSDLDRAEILQEWGLDVMHLATNSDLSLLLDGKMTGLRVLYPKVQGIRFPLEARLSLRRKGGGGWQIYPHAVRSVDRMETVSGIQLSQQDRAYLRAFRSLGRRAEAINPFSQEKEPCLLGVDPVSQDPSLLFLNHYRLPRSFMEHEFTDREQESLLMGDRIYVEDLKSRSGHTFCAWVFLDASRSALSLDFFEKALGQAERKPMVRKLPKRILGAGLTKEQSLLLEAGGWIYLEDMTGKSGRAFSSYIHRDNASGRLIFSKTPPAMDDLSLAGTNAHCAATAHG